MGEEANEQDIETKYVQGFYNTQSISFSNTRYKPWPKIITFYKENIFNKPYLLNILDSGCGNGRNSLYKEIICADNSLNLLKITDKPNKILSNIKQPIFKQNIFDYILSIAVLHHLSTRDDRLSVLRTYLSLLKDNKRSKMMIYVWAYEKIHTKKKFISMNQYFKTTTYAKRDYLCDWQQTGKLRYYYLYKIEEFTDELKVVGFNIEEIGFDQESIFAVVGKQILY